MSRPFVIFSIIMFVKSWLTWSVIFKDGLFWGVLLTEMPLIWLLFCLVEMFTSRRKLAVYMGINIGITAIFFAAIMYFKYYGVIVTYHALNQLNQVTAVKDSVYTIIDPYYVLIFIDLFLISIWLYNNKKTRRWRFHRPSKGTKRILISFSVVCLVVACGNIFQNQASINEFVKAEEMGILGYEAYNVFVNEQPIILDEAQYTQATIDQLKHIERPADPFLWQAAKGKSIIFIQMESFQNFLIDLTLDGQEVTPVMNRLAKDHFYFPNFYQQVGSGNTSDAEFVVNTSFYIPAKGAASKVYGTKMLPSWPKLLKEQGYVTETFHTNEVEFWNRDEMYPALGFDRYYDSAYFAGEDVVFFGSSDEVLYAKTADRLLDSHQAGQLSYSHVISMTAHHPYTIPENKQRLILSEYEEDTLVGNYLIAQNYADYALGLFIEQLKADGIWDESLVVIYGDHLGLPAHLLNPEDEVLLADILGHNYHDLDMLNVPLIIAATDVTYPAVFDQLGGHVDIMPTAANLAGVSLEDHLHFGQDLLNQAHNLLPLRYYLPSGSLIKDRTLFVSGKWFEDGAAYSFNAYGQEEHTTVTEEDFIRALELMQLSDSYVSQLQDRVK